MKKLQQHNVNTPEYWDKVYKQEISEGKIRFQRERFQKTTELIEEGKIVLDAGCGMGEFIEYLHERKPSCRIVGVDISREGLLEAKTKCKDFTSFYQLDLLKLNEKFKNTIDYVVSFETIEHLEKPDVFIENVRVALKQNGWFFLTTPYMNQVDGADEHLFSFDFLDMLSFFREPEWRLVSIFRYGRNFSNMYVIAQKL
jgi:2-polyprenyl-3-methyl-5-hydroxy-6-metoxy-1,4-benzoquinol methylase